MRIEQYSPSTGNSFVIRDNIIWTQNGFDLNVASSIGSSLASDYNDLYATASGQVGQWQSVPESSLFAWQSASLNDADSLSADPLFVNVAGSDFHVQSTNGSFHGGSLAPVLNMTTELPMTVPTPTPTDDAANSPAIDRGSPADPFNLEPTPNGSFVNLGAFGDTDQASISPASYVLVIHPNGGDNWATKQTFTILWHDDQIHAGGTQTVNIDLLQNSTVTNIVTGLSDTGSYAWTIPSTIASGTNYLIRVTETGSSSSSDTSDNTFSIVQTLGIYYVNDGTVAPGDITTAPGNDANNGLTPATPKADIQSVLNSYTLNPGDTIYVDTGTYNVSSNILLRAAQNGIIITGPGTAASASRYATAIEGDSPAQYYQLNETSGTVAADSSGNGVNATYVGSPSLAQTVSFGAPSATAVGFNGASQYVQLPSGFANIAGGFTFEAWVNPGSTNATENIFDLGNNSNNEIYLVKPDFTNNLELGGTYGTVNIGNALPFNAWQYIAVTISGGAVTIYRDGVSIGSGTITAPQNITRTTDKIAGGANFSDFYGEMEEAAFYSTVLSPTQIANHYSADGLAILNRGNTSGSASIFQLDGASNVTIENLTLTGGVYAVTDTSGVDSSGDTVTNCVIYANSSHGIYLLGNNYADNFTLSNSLLASNGGYGAYIAPNNTPLVTGNIFTANASGGVNLFTYGGTVTSNQVFSNTDDGIDISTGNAADVTTVSNNTVTANGESGISISDSTALVTGNTVSGQLNNGQYGIFAFGGNIVGNTMFNNTVGIYADGGTTSGNRIYGNTDEGILIASGAVITANFIYSNGTYGLEGGNNSSAVTTITNNLIYANPLGGFESTAPANIHLVNNTIYQLTGIGLTVTNSGPLSAASALVFRDNIIEVAAGPAYSIDDYTFPGFQADYNDIYITGTGSLALIAGHAVTNTTNWIYESNDDIHSIWLNPQFLNPAGADGILGYSGGVDHGGDDNFHVQSTSPTIDAGDPAAVYSNEPSPNGSRLNQGYDGDTASAATSPAAQSIQVTYPSAGAEKLVAGGTANITWVSNNVGSSAPDTAYENATLALSPAEYYRFDQTSGTTAVDSSGHNINGTYVGGVTLNQPGYLGAGYDSAITLNGTNGYVQLPSGFASFPNGLSFSEWVYPTSTGSYARFFDLGNGPASDNIVFCRSGTTNNLLFQVITGSTPGATVTANNVLVLNQWQQVGVTMTATGAVTIYWNGAAVATGTTSVPNNITRNDNYLGRSNYTSDAYYAGSIDEAAFFNSVLTSQQILSQYAAQYGTVHIDLTNAAGTTLQSIATNVPNTGSYSWSIPSNLAPGQYKIRVTSDLNGTWTDISDNSFLIAPAGNIYYVNPNSTGGYYTTAGGSDANDGKTPGTPMASIEAVINAYHPGAGATIYVDSGTSTLLENIVLTSADSGLTIEGTPTYSSILNRGSANSGDYVFDLQNATNVILDHLAITGAFTGINASAGTTETGITISNDLIYSNTVYGIFDNNQSGWVITGDSIHDTTNSAGGGIYMPNGGTNTITNNTLFNNPGYGIYAILGGGSPIISGNTAYANGGGIVAEGPITVTGNTVYSNSSFGIDAQGNVLVVGNTAYNQTSSTSSAGIELNGAEARSNIVYDNYIGITAANFATVDRNKIYSNISSGISFGSGSAGQIMENLIYANAGPAISLNNINGSLGVQIANNTIYQIATDAVKLVTSPDVAIRNNILWTQNGYDLDLDTTSQTNFVSDYNDLYITGGGKVGFWGGSAQPTLANWQSASSQDAHSISANPNFVDIDGADNVLGYTTANNGANDGADDDFYLSAGSPAIDSGYSWSGDSTDIEGIPHTDDPGTPNTGSPDYVPAVQSSSLFTSGGTAQNWNVGSGGTYWTLSLPFTFSFYGVNYTSVNVGSNGMLMLGSTSAVSTANSDANLATHTLIAPLWDALEINQTGNNIFVTSSSTQVTIRWAATQVSGTKAVNFDVILFSNGQIEFDYGSGNTGLTPTVGISSGDGQHFQTVSGYDGNVDTHQRGFDHLQHGRRLCGHGCLRIPRQQQHHHAAHADRNDSRSNQRQRLDQPDPADRPDLQRCFELR